MSNFTLVTGLWDIKRGDLTEFNRPFDHYLENFDKLLSLNCNMCVYIPKNLHRFVLDRRNHTNTKIVIYELEDFKKNFAFFDEVQKIRTKEWWYNKADWLANSPQAKLEYYNPVVMSKFFFLHDNCVHKTFDSDYYFWIDAGLTNTVSLDSIKNVEKLPDYMKDIDNKFLFLSFPYTNDNEVHGFDSQKFAEFCGVDRTGYVCRGGFFGGHKKHISKFNGEYYSIIGHTLNDNCMGTEENFHTIMAYNNPNEIHRFELEDNGLIYLFFDHLATVKPRKVINGGLIPWEKHKAIEDIKTSLYVLTFNSPKQFKALIESYSKNSPEFLTNTRKILIDNSTDALTYAEYNKLCREHNFEHIKKETNTGICGARQFVAEHFNESDSEYYIFLEDDMTAHEATEELCESGYRQHIEDLYTKSLTIIHRNRYDYLKLSYTEFYGTNKTQWSWYNIPQDLRTEYFPEKPNLPKEGLDKDAPKTEVFQEKRFKDLKYLEGEFHYCNWPLWFSKEGNKKVFLDTKWNSPYEQTWMSHVFQMQKEGKIKCAVLELSPIFHHRFEFYPAEERKES